MILYFSPTGNSAYVAKRIGEALQDKALDLFEKIRSNDYSELHSERPWIIAAPTYAWRIPRILHNWLEKTSLKGNKNIYFVMTCGAKIGNAGTYLENLSAAKGLNYMGCVPVVMPENYIALFGTPTLDEALLVIEHSEDSINKATAQIKSGEHFSPVSTTFNERMISGIGNLIFYPAFVHAKKFYATDACNACGKCQKVCPLNNIQFKNEKPVWGRHCTHCMACINRCPRKSIEYGQHSKGLVRYTCPKKI